MPSKCEVCFVRPIDSVLGITNVCDAPECLAQMQECVSGEACQSQRYFKSEDHELNHKGRCADCDDVIDAENGEMCEFCPDEVPAVSWVGGHSLCENCATDAM